MLLHDYISLYRCMLYTLHTMYNHMFTHSKFSDLVSLQD
jgi:hypothetical protein